MKKCDAFVVKMFLRDGNRLRDIGSAFSPAVIGVKGCSEEKIVKFVHERVRDDLLVNVEKMLSISDEDADELYETGGIGNFNAFKEYMMQFKRHIV